MDLQLNKLNYSFIQKPILVGGKAMEYYGLRKSGEDTDLIASVEDVANLIKIYPTRLKDLGGDLGVCPFEFEIWKTVCFFDYGFYKEDAEEKEDHFVVSIEKLLFMKGLAIEEEKYLNDVKLITGHILNEQNKLHKMVVSENTQLLSGVNGVVYIEKSVAESK